jgi:hypothetical protein
MTKFAHDDSFERKPVFGACTVIYATVSKLDSPDSKNHARGLMAMPMLHLPKENEVSR